MADRAVLNRLAREAWRSMGRSAEQQSVSVRMDDGDAVRVLRGAEIATDRLRMVSR